MKAVRLVCIQAVQMYYVDRIPFMACKICRPISVKIAAFETLDFFSMVVVFPLSFKNVEWCRSSSKSAWKVY